MPMIKCPECGSDVSDKAKACLKCAYPLNPSARPLQQVVVQANQPRVQTIERTSKQLKGQMLAATTLVFGGCVAFCGSDKADGAVLPTLGMVAVLGGVIWLAVTKLSVWWHHE